MLNRRNIELKPIPFLIIRSVSSADIVAQSQQELDADVKCYLDLLLAYKNILLAEGNGYHTNASSETLKNLLASTLNLSETIPDSSNEFKAAIINLSGFVQGHLDPILHGAIHQFQVAMTLCGTTIGEATTLCNIISLYQYAKPSHLAETLQYAALATDLLRGQAAHELPQTEKEIIAGNYFTLGRNARKNHHPELATQLFRQALEIWPQNHIIANHLAAHLSKLNNEQSLRQAQGILESLLPSAKKYDFFMASYYLADVSIKLSVFNNEEQQIYIDSAATQIHCADRILESNTDYSENYQQKTRAKLAHLKTNLALIQKNSKAASDWQGLARRFRESVVETPAKKEKFYKKFIPLSTLPEAFNRSLLFRPRPAAVQPEIKMNDHDNLNSFQL